MQNKELPKGWDIKTVKEISSLIQSGFACSKKHQKEGGYPHLRTHNISPTGQLNFDLLIKIDEDKVDERRAKIEKGDILFNNTNSQELVGKTCYVDQDYDYGYSNHLTKVKVKPSVKAQYLVFYFNLLLSQGYFSRICKRWIGQAGVNNTKLKSIEIPLPPLPEQKRIVQKLDALFADIDEAIRLLKDNQAALPKLKASVLERAFSGNKSWNKSILSDVVDFIGGSQPPKSKFIYEKKEGYIRLIQIRDYKSDNHLVYIPEDSTKKFCEEDDIMIGRYGPPVFQILKGIRGAYNVALMKAIPNEKLISKDFLYWFLQSPDIQNYIISISQRSAGQSGVNKKALEKYDILYPSLPEQKRIVQKLESIFKELDALDVAYVQKLDDLEDLKKSLLEAAFKGEL